MAFDLKEFAVDAKKELDGVWENIGGDAELLIARIGNPKYKEAFRKLPRGTRRMIESGTLPEAQSEKMFCQILASTVLLGWKNLIEDGKDVLYSEEKAAEMLLKYPEFRAIVEDLGNDMRRFHEESKEADLKN